MFISADMGAPALDRWRSQLPNQFIYAGISEQNAINVASGLSRGGKKVFVYFMACWLARCLEQVRYSCAIAGNPITILGNGVGLGYTPAGPAHAATDDLCYARSIFGIQIWSPSDTTITPGLVNDLLRHRALTYIRLERDISDVMKESRPSTRDVFDHGQKVGRVYEGGEGLSSHISIASYGYMTGIALAAQEILFENGIVARVVDFLRVQPIAKDLLRECGGAQMGLLTLEEHALPGGFGSIVLEGLNDYGINPQRVLRLGLPDNYLFENGTRDSLLRANGLDAESVAAVAVKICSLESSVPSQSRV